MNVENRDEVNGYFPKVVGKKVNITGLIDSFYSKQSGHHTISGRSENANHKLSMNVLCSPSFLLEKTGIDGSLRAHIPQMPLIFGFVHN